MCLVPTWTRGVFSVAQTPGLCTGLPTLPLPEPHSSSFHSPTEQVQLFPRTFALASPLPGMLWSRWIDSSSDVCSKFTFSGKASSTTPPQCSCQGEPTSYLLPTQPLFITSPGSSHNISPHLGWPCFLVCLLAHHAFPAEPLAPCSCCILIN